MQTSYGIYGILDKKSSEQLTRIHFREYLFLFVIQRMDSNKILFTLKREKYYFCPFCKQNPFFILFTGFVYRILKIGGEDALKKTKMRLKGHANIQYVRSAKRSHKFPIKATKDDDRTNEGRAKRGHFTGVRVSPRKLVLSSVPIATTPILSR